MNETNLYKIYQLISFFILKFSYKTLNVPNKKDDEIWLVNPGHEYYPLIRITLNTIEQVIFEQERIDETVKMVFKRLRINKGRFLDVHVTKDEVLNSEIYDSLALESNYHSGLELNDIFPGINNVVHDVENGTLEIQEIFQELNTYSKQARTQKRNLKVKLPLVTSITIAICFGMYLLSQFLGSRYGLTNALIFLGGDYKMFTVGLGQFFRLITVGFLHSGLVHLLMNMLALYSLGSSLEKEIGSLKFAIVLYGSVILSSLFSLMLNENQLSVGLSGGIYGLFGIYLAIAYKHHALNDPSTRNTIFINLLINFMPGINYIAHIGGLVAGVVFYFILSGRKEFYIVYLVLITILSFKIYTTHDIYPKYGGTDTEVIEIYRDLGLDSYADKLENKLIEAYKEW